MRGVRALNYVAILALTTTTGCSLFCGKPRAPIVDPERSAYWIWHSGGSWHLRVTTAGETHRFQGTVTAKSSPIQKLKFGDDRLRDHAAMLEHSGVQFDFERNTPASIDFRLLNRAACIELDLYVDGMHRLERIYLGPYARSPLHMPIEVCPGR